MSRNVTGCDREVLFVAAMLHDMALFDPFDAHAADFEVASGAIGTIVATALGWDRQRSRRVAEVIEAHMGDAPDPGIAPEGFVLEAATAADVGGRDLDLWDADELRTLESHFPRHGFADCFGSAIAQQSARKPGSAAAALHASGRIHTGDRVWDRLLPTGGYRSRGL